MVCFKIIIPSSCAHGLTLKAAVFDRRMDNGAESQGEYYDLITISFTYQFLSYTTENAKNIAANEISVNRRHLLLK